MILSNSLSSFFNIGCRTIRYPLQSAIGHPDQGQQLPCLRSIAGGWGLGKGYGYTHGKVYGHGYWYGHVISLGWLSHEMLACQPNRAGNLLPAFHRPAKWLSGVVQTGRDWFRGLECSTSFTKVQQFRLTKWYEFPACGTS